MADGNYARLREGRPGFAALVDSQRRGKPGRPRGSRDPKPREFGMHEQALCADPRCGASFIRKLPHERFCSRKCGNRVNNRKKQEKLRQSTRSCKWCGSVFHPEYGVFRLAYCSDACRDAAQRNVRSGSTHRRRARRFGCEYEPLSKWDVFERDGWRCYICGRPTPKEASGTGASNAPELDHVIPMKLGGPHTSANVRCSCRECNRRKGASVIGEAGAV